MNSAVICNPAFKKKSGLVSDLLRSVPEDEIMRLERLGYIENGVSPNGETWKLTRKGVEYRSFMLPSRSVADGITDWILNKIVGFRVSL